MSDVSTAISNIQHLTSHIGFVCKLKAGEIQGKLQSNRLHFADAEGHM
jgi:hypothetical protein